MDAAPAFPLRRQLAALAGINLLWRRLPVRRVFLKQVYFTGVQALPLLLVAAVAVAGILVGQLREFGQPPRAALDILLAITVDELAPLLTALLVAARSAPALASELATMQARGEVLLLQRLGLAPLQYLLVPRVAAMLLSALLLVVYFAFVVAFAGSFFAAGGHFLDALLVAAESLGADRVLAGMGKGMLFGALVALVACHTGLAARGSWSEVPIAASRAVVRSIALLLLADLLLVVSR